MNPLDLTSDLKKTYLRYLRTSFSLRDPELMKSFAEKLECFTFFRGPFLEATPPFETGIFLKELVSEGLLDERFSVLLDTAMPIMARNRLYRHQEKAIRKILSGRNVVIASGTGSGKTESFLIPVLDDILKAYRAGTLAPGIRALILYPMNALVNDQLRRLRKIGNAMISDAGKPILTFGRYTGETPETQPQGLTLFRRQNLGVEPAAGELLSRDEMRAAPPHILITNYAMLEYLLIRPGDIPLFESSGGDGWKFLILDEAHVYTGAMGTEIALLMRRLRNRVGRGQRDSMRCVATSATLADDEQDYPQIARFASDLFGADVEWVEEDPARQDIVGASRIRYTTAPDSRPLPETAYRELREIALIPRGGAWKERLKALTDAWGIGSATWESCTEPFSAVNRIVQSDTVFQNVRSLLCEGPVEMSRIPGMLAERGVIGKGIDKRIITDLVGAASAAKESEDGLPALPARYHFFIRSPEGLFARLHSPREVFLSRRYEDGEGMAVFEIGICAR